jgi:hypothetical protein
VAKYTSFVKKPPSVPAPGPGSRDDGISHLLRAAPPAALPAPRQVVLLSRRSLARLDGKAGREARFAALFFQRRLILINDIWLGVAILGFCFLNCITVLMVGSIHAVIQEGSAAEEPSRALAPLGPKAFCDELSLWSVVGMQHRCVSSISRADKVFRDPDSPARGSSAANFGSRVTFFTP